MKWIEEVEIELVFMFTENTQEHTLLPFLVPRYERI